MPFDAGAIVGKAMIDPRPWQSGVKSIGQSNSFLGKSLKVVGGLAAGMTAAFVGGLVASAKVTDQFNKKFSNVRTLVDETEVNVSSLRTQLLGLDSRLGSSIDLTEGLYQALSAGQDPANAVKFVGDAAKFAKASLIDTNTAVDVITTSLNAYKDSSLTAAQVSDILFQTIKQGKTTGVELSATIGSVIPTAATLGVTMEELGASIATMTKQGINSAEATTQLNALMTAFIKPSERMQEALKDMGFASGSALLESEGLAGALELLQQATDGNKEELAEMLPNVRALKGAFALTGDQAEVFEQILEEMKNSAGATDEAFEKQELTFDTLKNSLEKMAILIGEKILPVVYDLVNAFSDFISNGENLGKIVGGIEVALTAFSLAWDVVKDTVLSIIDNLRKNMDKLADDKKIDWFTILAGVIRTLGIGFKIAGKFIEKAANNFFNLADIVQESIKIIGAFFDAATGKKKWSEVGKQAGKAWDSIKKFGKDFATAWPDIITTVIDEFKEFPNEVEQSTIKLRDAWKKNLKSNGGLSEPVEDELDETANVIDTFGEDIDKKSENIGNKFLKNIKKIGEGIKAFFDGIGGKVIENITFVVNKAAELYNTISGMAEQALQQELQELQHNNAQKITELERNKEQTILSKQNEFQGLLEALQEQRDNELITEEEFNEQKAELDEKKNEETLALEQRLSDEIAETKLNARKEEIAQQERIFEAQKANQIANVWIQTALGIAAAWGQSIATLGPVAGSIAAAALSTVLTGVAIAQTAIIARQKFIPAFQDGGMAGGTVRVNEAGGEIITLPDGSQVIPNDISRQIAANTGNKQEININVTGNTISNMLNVDQMIAKIKFELGKELRGMV